MIDWDQLRTRVCGRLRLPSDPGFAARSRPVNDRYRGVRPAAVLSAAGPTDVAAAVTWARERGVPLTARGGGHSYAGNAVTSGLVLDLQDLDEIRVDPDTGLVRVAGGARMKAIYQALRDYDLAFPLGNSDGVGIGGLVLGGGVAAVSRTYGLTCDALVQTEVVLADGTLLTCDADRNADLFWACRGGGGGNFGVNTSFTFQAHEVTPASTCLVLWHGRHAVEVLYRMQQIMRDAPDRFAARIGVNRAGGEPTVVSVVGKHLGPAEELRELLAPALAAVPADRVDIADRTYWDAADFLHHNSAGGAFAVRTRCAPEPLAEAGLRALVRALEQWPGSGNPDGAGVALFTWGGAINRVPVTATAFPHRDVLFLLSIDVAWDPADLAHVAEANLAWLARLHTEMGAFATDGAYLNFTDPDLAGWPTAYHGQNLHRLREVKNRYDPDRFFTFPQAV